MNRIKRIWILGLLLIGASCNSWLDVAPEDQIMEKDLFEEKRGVSDGFKRGVPEYE